MTFHRFRWFPLFLLVTLFMLFPAPETGAAEPVFPSELSLFEEIPSVVGASKYEQKVTEAPASVSIVTAAEIRKYGYRSLADVLRSLRSFHVTNDLNYEYAAVRGFGRPGDYNSRLLVLVDGHRINENIFGLVGIGQDFPIHVDLIDRIEVIRGPSSSLYGTGAFFGVINVITRRGRDLGGFEVAAAAASQKTYEGRFSYGTRLPAGAELLVSGTGFSSDGDDWHFPEFDATARDLDGEDANSLFLKTSWGPLTLTGAFVNREKDVPTAPFETAFGERTSTEDERSYLDLAYEETVAEVWDVAARIFFDSTRYDGRYPYDYAEEGQDPDIVVFKDYAYGDWFGAEAQLGRRFGTRNHLILGADYRNNLRQDQGAFDDAPRYTYFRDRRDSTYWAVYAQDEFRIAEPLVLNLGLRHDDYDTFGSTTNPRLALIYTPLEKTNIKLLYGKAFRAPNNFELYYDDGGISQKASPDLDPEKITTYEMVVEQFFGNNIRGLLAGFYYEIDDLIDLDVDPNDELLFFQNLSEVEAWGVEAELEGKLGNGMSGRLSYTFQETEDQETGSRLSNSPRHLGKLNLSFPLWQERLFLSVEERYTGPRDTAGGDEAGGFLLTNLTLFGRNLLPGLEIQASAFNLFDKQYGDPAGEEHAQVTIPQQGRVYRLELTYAF